MATAINKKGLLSYSKMGNFRFIDRLFIPSIVYRDLVTQKSSKGLQEVLSTLKDNISIYPNEKAKKSLDKLFSRKQRSNSLAYKRFLVELSLNIQPEMLDKDFLREIQKNYFKDFELGEERRLDLKAMLEVFLGNVVLLLKDLKDSTVSRSYINGKKEVIKALSIEDLNESFVSVIERTTRNVLKRNKFILDMIFESRREEFKKEKELYKERRKEERERNKKARELLKERKEEEKRKKKAQVMLDLDYISSIPNWRDNRFLMDVHRQIRQYRSPMTPKQRIFVEKHKSKYTLKSPKSQIRKGVADISLESWVKSNSDRLLESVNDMGIIDENVGEIAFISSAKIQNEVYDLSIFLSDYFNLSKGWAKQFRRNITKFKEFFAQSQGLFMKSPYIIACIFDLSDSTENITLTADAKKAIGLVEDRGAKELDYSLVYPFIFARNGSTLTAFFQPYWLKYLLENPKEAIYYGFDLNFFLSPLSKFLEESGYNEKILRYDIPKQNPDHDWIGDVFEEIEEKGTEGAFTRYAASKGYTTVKGRRKLAKMIVRGYEDWIDDGRAGKPPYSLKTYRRAQFLLNIRKRNPSQKRIDQVKRDMEILGNKLRKELEIRRDREITVEDFYEFFDMLGLRDYWSEYDLFEDWTGADEDYGDRELRSDASFDIEDWGSLIEIEFDGDPESKPFRFVGKDYNLSDLEDIIYDVNRYLSLVRSWKKISRPTQNPFGG